MFRFRKIIIAVEKTSYRPEIDGLRALAVVAVVLFHVGLGFPGGYIGVDVFFVISGFLITGIIRRGLERSTFSLAEFWERRVRRIFPALFVNVVGTLGLGYCFLLPQEFEELGKSSVAQALLLSNVYFWSDTGYFAGPAELKPLLHTWSLAVEEQFYLFFPLLLVFFKSQSRQRLFGWLACISIISFGASVYGTTFHSGATFFLLPTRAWELLVGCMLAVLPWKLSSRPRRDGTIAVTGLLAIIVPIFCYDSNTPFPGLAAIPPVFGAAAVIYATATTRGTLVGRVLSFRPVVFVGLISYSLYLWHWPVIVFVRMYFGHLGWKQIIFALVCSLTLALLSWKFIETPCRRNTFLPRRRRLFGTAFLLSGATVAVSHLMVGTGGLPSRFPNYSTELFEDTLYPGTIYATSKEEDEFYFDELPLLGVEAKPSGNEKQVDFIVWGDSHGMMLCGAIDHTAGELGLTGRAMVWGGQVPGPNLVCRNNNPSKSSALMKWMDANRPRNLIVINRWSYRTNGLNEPEAGNLPHEDNFLSDVTHESKSYEDSSAALQRSLQGLASFCEQSGITLWILKQVPEINEQHAARDVLMYSLERRQSLPDKTASIDQHRARQERPSRILASINSSAVRIVDPAPYLFDENGDVIIVRGGRSCYYDEDHLTSWGASALSPLFMEIFTEMKLQKSNVNKNPE